MFVYTRTIENTLDIDVLVCGAGSAGVPAAIAAARLGVRTVVLEKHGFAGGIITAVQTPGLDGMHDVRNGRVVIGGVGRELAERIGLSIRDASADEVVLSHETREKGWGGPGTLAKSKNELKRAEDAVSMPMDPERFKLIADRMLAEAGVTVLYHTMIVDVIAKDGRIDTVIAANKDGLLAVRAKVFVDCTGDGDVVAWAGAPHEVCEQTQPMSLHFRFGNVPTTPEVRVKCAEVLQEARRRGEFGVYGGPWLRAMAHDQFLVNAVRVIGNALDPSDLTRAERQGREDAWGMFDLWRKHIPEFRDAHFIVSGPSIGARETRRIIGDYTLTADDILAMRRFEDVVSKGAWYLDQHPSDGYSGFHSHRAVSAYDIPYRTLLPQKLENALVAGRCHSATHEALSSTRVTATAMGMGEAAGTAAALAVRAVKTPRSLRITDLHDRLRAQKVILD